jgi:hypothetical protein
VIGQQQLPSILASQCSPPINNSTNSIVAQ